MWWGGDEALRDGGPMWECGCGWDCCCGVGGRGAIWAMGGLGGGVEGAVDGCVDG